MWCVCVVSSLITHANVNVATSICRIGIPTNITHHARVTKTHMGINNERFPSSLPHDDGCATKPREQRKIDHDTIRCACEYVKYIHVHFATFNCIHHTGYDDVISANSVVGTEKHSVEGAIPKFLSSSFPLCNFPCFSQLFSPPRLLASRMWNKEIARKNETNNEFIIPWSLSIKKNKI